MRPHPESTWAEVAGAIEAAATRVANAPVILWPDCVGRRRAPHLAGRARLLGVRALVWTAEVPREALREQLTDQADFPGAVMLWVRRRGMEVSTEAGALLEILARHSRAYHSLAHLAAEHGAARRTWDRTFEASGLGHAARWHGALRTGGIGTIIQREPGTRLIELALRFGFSSASALSDRLYEVIGARPEFIRQHLGVQWMLADAVRRCGIM